MSIETITLGSGCFWCIENVLKRIKGVNTVVSGYANGDTKNPTYEQVISGTTNYVEVVQVTFDNEKITLEVILTVFFAIHDPTTLNRQGNDVGNQYRSAILYHNDRQQSIAFNARAKLNRQKAFENPVVTEVKEINSFYSAESYHQDYVENNPDSRYCQIIVARKIQKFLADFPHLLKEETYS